MKILLIRPLVKKVNTFLSRTYVGLGILTPKSNVTVSLDDDFVELIYIGTQNNDDLFIVGDLILIFPHGSYIVIWERQFGNFKS